MTYEGFLKYIKDKDYIMIKLTDEYPFFIEKVFVKAGETNTASNYHIADGMTSHYINYEMPDNGISAEISGPIKFEISGKYDCPVYAMNTSKNTIEVRVYLRGFSSTCTWPLEAGEVVPIYPEDLAKVIDEIISEELLAQKHPEMFLTQSEISALLRGEVPPSSNDSLSNK